MRNLILYRLENWRITAAELIDLLQSQLFVECQSLEDSSGGWVPPRENAEIVHQVGNVLVLAYKTEKRLLPPVVIKEVMKLRSAELEEQQGFPPGRKQLKELKEQVRDELLPRAFAIPKTTRVLIDLAGGWLMMDSSSQSVAEDILKLLYKAIPKFPLESLRTQMSAVSAMTMWLSNDEAPAGFSVDQDTELRSTGEGHAAVRYSRHSLDPEEVERHIQSGKECIRLALTWDSKLSFVLTQDLKIRQIAILDTNKEQAEPVGKNAEERFDGDIALNAGLIGSMLKALIEQLGGLLKPEQQAAQEQQLKAA